MFCPIREDEPFSSVRLYADNLVPALAARGVDVRRVELSRRFRRALPPRVNGPLNRYMVYPAYAARRQGTINHVLDHAYGHLTFALDARRTVVSCNSMSLPKAMRGRIPGFRIPAVRRTSMWIRHRGMLRARRIVACSHALKQDIVEFFGCDPARIAVVHDGIDHETFKPETDRHRLDRVRRAYRLPDDRTKVLLVVSAEGGEGYKNRMGALRTHEILLGRGYRVLLVLVGAALVDVERQFLTARGIGPHVTCVGRVPVADLVGLYNVADALLFPSWDEGFGYPPVEAMACGTPVVVSKIPVLLETTGGAALAGAPDNPEELADCIQRIFDDERVADRLREAGLARARAFSWARYADEILQVYRDVADS